MEVATTRPGTAPQAVGGEENPDRPRLIVRSPGRVRALGFEHCVANMYLIPVGLLAEGASELHRGGIDGGLHAATFVKIDTAHDVQVIPGARATHRHDREMS